MGKTREQSVGDRKRDINRESISYSSFFLMQHDYKWLFSHNHFETHKLSQRILCSAVYVDGSFNHFSVPSEPISCPHIASMISQLRRAKTKSFLFTMLANVTGGQNFKEEFPFIVIQNFIIEIDPICFSLIIICSGF